MTETKLPLLPNDSRVILFTGNYGSGKTEVSVNYVYALSELNLKVTIADLDLVNPYFRCREAREGMEEKGIKVLAPSGDMHNADLPIVMPEVLGAIGNSDGITVLDVGGDNVGATVLASLAVGFRKIPYEMNFVLNENRPFTDSVDGALQLMDEIEAASRLSITSLVGNTHLMDETNLDMVRKSIDFTKEVAEKRGISVAFATAPIKDLHRAGYLSVEDEKVDALYQLDGFDVPILPLRRIMLPPWLGGPTPGSMSTHSRDGFARLTES